MTDDKPSTDQVPTDQVSTDKPPTDRPEFLADLVSWAEGLSEADLEVALEALRLERALRRPHHRRGMYSRTTAIALRLLREGRKPREIAQELGISRQQVYKVRKYLER